jgi:predicted dehydrogenase
METHRKIRYGILGAARIATETVIPAIQRGEFSEVAAIASRSLEKAQAAAQRLGIGKAYGAYEDLLADADIDAIYNPLPNHLHVPWSIKALEAGKHVLCEKPIAPTVAEALRLVEAARQRPHLKVMEAFMYRFHPQWQLAEMLLRSGEIGELRSLHVFFCYHNTDPANIRNQADIGGGGLLDVGCYALSVSRLLFDAEPRRVMASLDYDPKFQTDRLASGLLDFEHGTATFTCSTQSASYQRAVILGSEGSIEIDIPFNAPPDRPSKVTHRRGESSEVIMVEASDQFTLQADQFAQAILNGHDVPTPLSDAVANLQVLEATLESARRGCWVAPGEAREN